MTSSLKFEITVYFFWLSLPVHSGSLKRIDYPKQLSCQSSFFCMSLLLLKELIIIFLFKVIQSSSNDRFLHNFIEDATNVDQMT